MMSFFQNTCKPVGLGGKLMVNGMNLGHAKMAAWGLSHFELPESGTILDLGCGGGANVKKFLAYTHCKVIGLDYSPVSVQKSIQLNQKEINKGRCKILQGDVMNLHFQSASFDLITAFETIYFWPNLEVAFKEIFHLLKNNGIFFICNESNGEIPGQEKWTHIIEGMVIYDQDRLNNLLLKAGFSDIQIDKTPKGWISIIAVRKN